MDSMQFEELKKTGLVLSNVKFGALADQGTVFDNITLGNLNKCRVTIEKKDWQHPVLQGLKVDAAMKIKTACLTFVHHRNKAIEGGIHTENGYVITSGPQGTPHSTSSLSTIEFPPRTLIFSPRSRGDDSPPAHEGTKSATGYSMWHEARLAWFPPKANGTASTMYKHVVRRSEDFVVLKLNSPSSTKLPEGDPRLTFNYRSTPTLVQLVPIDKEHLFGRNAGVPVLWDDGPLTPTRVHIRSKHYRQLLKDIDRLNQHGIYAMDLKPDNLMFDPLDQRVVMIDCNPEDLTVESDEVYNRSLLVDDIPQHHRSAAYMKAYQTATMILTMIMVETIQTARARRKSNEDCQRIANSFLFYKSPARWGYFGFPPEHVHIIEQRVDGQIIKFFEQPGWFSENTREPLLRLLTAWPGHEWKGQPLPLLSEALVSDGEP